MKATTGKQSITGRPVQRDENRSAARTLPQSSSEELIRSLANRLSSERQVVAESSMADRAEEVLFDAEVDGTRNLFIRMPKTEKFRLSAVPPEVSRKGVMRRPGTLSTALPYLRYPA